MTLDIPIVTASGNGRLTIPDLSTAAETKAVVKQLRAIAKLLTQQAKHLPDAIVTGCGICGGSCPEGEQCRTVPEITTPCDRGGCQSPRTFGQRFCPRCQASWISLTGGVDKFDDDGVEF